MTGRLFPAAIFVINAFGCHSFKKNSFFKNLKKKENLPNTFVYIMHGVGLFYVICAICVCTWLLFLKQIIYNEIFKYKIEKKMF